MILIVLSLFVGYLKGRFVLSKTAKRGVDRIIAFPNPAQITKIYSPKYYILLAIMVGLGVSIKYLGLKPDIRGVIDAIIGSALINGALIYFKYASALRQRHSNP